MSLTSNVLFVVITSYVPLSDNVILEMGQSSNNPTQYRSSFESPQFLSYLTSQLVLKLAVSEYVWLIVNPHSLNELGNSYNVH